MYSRELLHRGYIHIAILGFFNDIRISLTTSFEKNTLYIMQKTEIGEALS